MARCPWFNRGRYAAEYLVRQLELEFVLMGNRPPRPTLLDRAGQNLVVNVGDVAAQHNLVSADAQPTREDVEHQTGADVADVRGGLHRGAAQVHRDLAGFERDKVPYRPGRGVVQA